MGDDNKGKALLSPNDRGKQASSSSSTCPDPGEHIARILEHLEGLPIIQSQRTPLLSEEVCSSFVSHLMNTLAHRVFDGHFDMQSFRHEISMWLHSKIKGLKEGMVLQKCGIQVWTVQGVLLVLWRTRQKRNPPILFLLLLSN